MGSLTVETRWGYVVVEISCYYFFNPAIRFETKVLKHGAGWANVRVYKMTTNHLLNQSPRVLEERSRPTLESIRDNIEALPPVATAASPAAAAMAVDVPPAAKAAVKDEVAMVVDSPPAAKAAAPAAAATAADLPPAAVDMMAMLQQTMVQQAEQNRQAADRNRRLADELAKANRMNQQLVQ